MCAVSLFFQEACAPNWGYTYRFCYAIDFFNFTYLCLFYIIATSVSVYPGSGNRLFS